MISAALIVTSLAAALILRRQLWLSVSIYLAVWVLYPWAAVAIDISSTGLYGLHPASLFMVLVFFIAVASEARYFATAMSRRPMALLFALIAVLMVITTAVGSGGIALSINQILIPTAALISTLAAEEQQPGSITRVLNCIVALAAFEALVGLVEAASQRNLFYTRENALYYPQWYIGFQRPLATTAHSLVYGTLISAAIPLLSRYKYKPLLLGLAALFGLAAVTSETRTTLICASLGLLYLLVRSSMRAQWRLLLALGLATFSAIILLNASSIAVFQRFQADNNSASRRGAALDWFIANFMQLPPVGHGMGSSFDLAASVGLTSSFESAPMQMVIDFGIPIATLFYALIAFLLVLPSARRRIRGAVPATAIILIATATYSSLTVQTLDGPLLMIILGAASYRFRQTDLDRVTLSGFDCRMVVEA